MSSQNIKGMTLTDLILGLVLCVLILTALVPAAGVLDEARNKTLCARNLKNIAAALATYSNTNNGKYPRTYFDPGTYGPKPVDTITVVAYTGWKSKDPFTGTDVSPNDATAGLYLLIRDAELDPSMFVCPSSKAKALHFGAGAGDIAAKPTDISNFPSEECLSYSGSCPYPSVAAFATQWVWDSTLADDAPLISDMNPGGQAVLKVTTKSTAEGLHKANSLNHGGAGQNVLYGDYHIEFQTTPLCGPKEEKINIRDNIFTRSADYHDEPEKIVKKELKGDPIMGPPTDRWDTVMVPPADYKPAGAKPATPEKAK